MSSLVQYGKYGALNTTGTATNGFNVIMFTSEECTLQSNTTIYGKIITACELVVKSQYILYQHSQQQVITVLTCTILHPLLDFTAITDIHDITKSVCSSTQAKINTRTSYFSD